MINPFRESAEVPESVRMLDPAQFERWCHMQQDIEKNRTSRSEARTIGFIIVTVLALTLGAFLKGCQMSTTADVEKAKYTACPTTATAKAPQ